MTANAACDALKSAPDSSGWELQILYCKCTVSTFNKVTEDPIKEYDLWWEKYQFGEISFAIITPLRCFKAEF